MPPLGKLHRKEGGVPEYPTTLLLEVQWRALGGAGLSLKITRRTELSFIIHSYFWSGCGRAAALRGGLEVEEIFVLAGVAGFEDASPGLVTVPFGLGEEEAKTSV